VGRPVGGSVVWPVIQDLTDGPDDRSMRVVKSVWYCKHIGMAFVTSSSHLLFRFSGTDEQTERRLCYTAMAALLVVQNYPTTGFLAQAYIASLRPTDIDPSSGPSSRRLLVRPWIAHTGG